MLKLHYTDLLGDLENSNIEGMLKCTSAAMVITDTGLRLANAATPIKAAMVVATKVNSLSKAVETINEHGPDALKGMNNIFQHLFETNNSNNDFEKEPKASCRAG